MNLIDALKSVRDRRTKPKYPQWIVLLLVIMATMSGRYGYRPLARFVHRHQQAVLDYLELPYDRLPSLSTLRRVMIHLDFEALTEAFNQWALSQASELERKEPRHLATDGKAIKASVRGYNQSYQDFAVTVSMYCVETGQVEALANFRHKETSEITVVQQLLEQLQLTGVCVSPDALHAQKKR